MVKFNPKIAVYLVPYITGNKNLLLGESISYTMGLSDLPDILPSGL